MFTNWTKKHFIGSLYLYPHFADCFIAFYIVWQNCLWSSKLCFFSLFCFLLTIDYFLHNDKQIWLILFLIHYFNYLHLYFKPRILFWLKHAIFFLYLMLFAAMKFHYTRVAHANVKILFAALFLCVIVSVKRCETRKTCVSAY
jgi:hypothetical protein